MGYYSDYYLEEFVGEIVKKFVILLNCVEEKEKQKYLLIIAQDLVTDKIIKLVDTHGQKYDLCKYDEKWANLQKGDIISVKCCFHKSKFCENVLRIKSNYQFIDKINYEKELEKVCEYIHFNQPQQVAAIKIFETDLEFLGKKLNGKHGFILYYLRKSEVIEYKKTGSDNIKYQFKIDINSKKCYADITPFVPEYKKFLEQEYSGAVLLQFVFKNDRLRLKVHDFLEHFFISYPDDDLPF